MENVEKIDASVVDDALQMHFYDWFLLRLIPWKYRKIFFWMTIAALWSPGIICMASMSCSGALHVGLPRLRLQ